jgi:hypothetical protein
METIQLSRDRAALSEELLGFERIAATIQTELQQRRVEELDRFLDKLAPKQRRRFKRRDKPNTDEWDL